jgi:vitamin B12 transporter
MVFIFVLLSLFLCRSSLAAEATPEQTLAPVMVTATRTESSPQEATTSISVITAEEIRQEGAVTILDALRNVPGLDIVQAGSPGSIASLFVRGANSNQVLVLLDGMELNSVTAGSFDFAHLLTDNVERIEVLRGAGGSLYGSKALGGVVNIITRKGSGSPQVTVSAEGGNERTHRETVGVSGKSGALGYALSSSYLRTEGFTINDGYRNASVSARLDYDVFENASLKGVFLMTDTKLGLVNNNNFIAVPDPDAGESDQHFTGQLEWQQHILPVWDYRVSFGVNQSHERFSDPDPLPFSAARTLIKPRILTPQFQTNYRFPSGHQLTFGIDLDFRQAAFTNKDSFGTVTAFQKTQDNQAVYLQDQWKLLDDRLLLIGGVRYDQNENFGSHWSPSASAGYYFQQTGTRLKTSYATSFRAPTFDDLFFPGFSNPNLRPEVSWETDAGVVQDLWQERMQIEATYFHRDVKDLITFKGLAPQNVGQVIFDGAELGLQTKLGYGFTLKGNYTYVNFDQPLTRRPKHKGNVILDYQSGPLNINFNAHVTGRRLDIDPINFNTINTPGFARFDLAASYTFPWTAPGVKQVRFYGKIQNLADKRYQEAAGFPARPLNFLIGLQGTFGKTP